MTELFGRQQLFAGTYLALAAFSAGGAGAQNMQTLAILRFFAGAFGSSPLTNSGGVIADMFSANERGMATSLFAAAPFMGPVFGPIVGGFVGETVGWRWIEGVEAIFVGVLLIIGVLVVPETYSPVILRERAKKLSALSGKVYISRMDYEQGTTTIGQAFKASLSRPWILLFREPIVFLLSIYMAIIYGTLYMLFSAFPIVYQVNRGWSAGIGGLAFLGVMVGMMFAVAYSIWDNKNYIKAGEKDPSGFAPAEARLPPTLIGAVAMPVGLFWFAWTNYPSIHWIASIAAGVPFGFGMVLVFLGIINYLIDAYVIFAASVLAANAVLRSLFGAAFPLFTTYMFDNLGIHWAGSIPAFLALACLPFPFLFYKYGASIRLKCRYAAEAAEFLKRIRASPNEDPSSDDTSVDDTEDEKSVDAAERARRLSRAREHEAELEAEAIDNSWRERRSPSGEGERFQPIRAGHHDHEHTLNRSGTGMSSRSNRSHREPVQYEGNPYDVDRVHTRESFGRPNSISGHSTKSTKSHK